MKFTRVYSLGMDCQTAYQIKRYYRYINSGPFDWWITYDYACVKYLNDPNWNTLYDRNHLSFKVDRIWNDHYGIELFHEFRDNVNNQIDPLWKEHVENHRVRTRYLTQRMLAPGGRILFIRQNDHNDAYEDICSALAKNYLYTPWELVMVNPPKVDAWQGNDDFWDSVLVKYDVEFDNVENGSIG